MLLSENEIERAASLLKAGQLVAFPTETVYGLGAPIFNPTAIQAIFHAKGRPADNPLIAHVSSLEQVKEIAREIPNAFYTLAERFFPGPLAVVLKCQPTVPLVATAGLDSIAVRMPSHPIALKLIEAVGQPLVAPSANLSGKPSSTESKHVLNDFSGTIAAVIEGGKTDIGLESTVISLLGEVPVLLRPGAITQEELEELLGVIVTLPTQEGPVLSPGMKYRHYAPKAPIKVFKRLEDVHVYLASAPRGLSRMFLARQPMQHPGLESFVLSAKEFYSLLRYADEKDYEEILVLCDAEMQRDAAFMNRLMKASGNN